MPPQLKGSSVCLLSRGLWVQIPPGALTLCTNCCCRGKQEVRLLARGWQRGYAALFAMNFDAVIEEKIRAAMEAGQFDDLIGRGKPLRLEENPHEPEAWRMAHKLLHDQGFTLPWIAERKEIEEAMEEALRALRRSYRETHRVERPDVWARLEWRRAAEAFAEAARKLNQRIHDYNLSVPNPIFHRSLVNAEKEIDRIGRESPTAAM